MLTLEVVDLAKRFDRRVVFSQLSFQAQTGELVALSGPNGSGKSTLLKIILGLLRPSGGETRVGDGEKFLSLAERLACAGVVTPYFELYDALSARENLAFFFTLRGRLLAKSEFGKWMELVGLSGREDDRVGEYSSGMKQRLKLALALALEPRLIFLDEPSSNLDSDGKARLWDCVARLRPQTIVVMASNEADEVSRADRVVSLAL